MFDLIVVTLGGYALFWSLPGTIISITISMGSLKYIIYIDKQLAKKLDYLYCSNGQMKNMTHTHIATRFHRYSICYPFIRYRSKNSSIKFKVFMWFNALGFWSWIGVFICMFLDKGLGIIN